MFPACNRRGISGWFNEWGSKKLAEVQSLKPLRDRATQETTVSRRDTWTTSFRGRQYRSPPFENRERWTTRQLPPLLVVL